MDGRRFLRDLEEYYPGVTAEYSNDTGSHSPIGDNDDDDNGEVQPPPRVRLRNAEAVPPLFGYQKDLVGEVERLCSTPRGENIGLLTLPTGAGKTRTMAVALLRVLTSGRARVVLWLAPTRELLEQAAATLQSVWWLDRNSVDVELVRADLLARFPDDLECGVLLATPHMVAARLRDGIVPDVDVVVFDEAHHVAAPVFQRALQQVRKRRNVVVIGLSATPGRTTEEETERLVDFFDGRLLRSKQLGRDPIAFLQRRGVLARMAFKDVPPEGSIRSGRKAWSATDTAWNMDRFRAAVRIACRLAKKARVLVFTASVEHAMLMAAALRCQGARAAAVSSWDGQEVRRKRLDAFERGELSVITNKRLLATGYDCPAVRHVVLATRIGSPILFEQIVGRASRGPLVGGHARSTVWQFEDHLAIHGLPQSYYRYSDYDWKHLGG